MAAPPSPGTEGAATILLRETFQYKGVLDIMGKNPEKQTVEAKNKRLLYLYLPGSLDLRPDNRKGGRRLSSKPARPNIDII